MNTVTRVLALGALALVAACGTQPPAQRSRHVLAADVQWSLGPVLPSGERAAVSDTARHTIWILTRVHDYPDAGAAGVGIPSPTFSDMPIELYSLDTHSGKAARIEVPAPSSGWLSGQIALDGDGQLWMSWGSVLLRYSPDLSTWKKWTIPSAATTMDYSPAGRVVAMAITPTSDQVWLGISGDSSIEVFHTDTSAWSTQPIFVSGTFNFGSQLAFDATGSPFGTLYTAPGVEQLIALTSGGTTFGPVSKFAVRRDGDIWGISASGAATRMSPTATVRTTALIGFTLTPAEPPPVLDSSGTLWVANGGSIARVDSDGSVTRDDLPTHPVTVGGIAGEVKSQVTANVEAMAFDDAGRTWLFTGSAADGSDGSFASSYHSG